MRLKKEILAASIAALSAMPQKGETKEVISSEIKTEIINEPEVKDDGGLGYHFEPITENNNYSNASGYRDEEKYVYDRKLSRGLSVRYSGAYINWETKHVIYKASDPIDEDYHSTLKSCLESQNHHTGVYDRSGDKNYIRERRIASYPMEEERYIYSPELSRGLSIKYSGAYINPITGEVIIKAVSRYDEDVHYNSIKSCRESQNFKTGQYDRSNDREIRREQIYNGEYGTNRGAVVRDVVRGIGEIIIRSQRGR